jgi:hypothetical protein
MEIDYNNLNDSELVNLANTHGYVVRGLGRQQIVQLLQAVASEPKNIPLPKPDDVRVLKLSEKVNELAKDVEALKVAVTAFTNDKKPTYKELQSRAKELGINPNQKKIDLQQEIELRSK